MATITHAREAVVQALYAREQGGDNWELLFLELLETKKLKGKKRDFALELWKGVNTHLSEIDQLLKKVLVNWNFDQLDKISKQILRLGIYEMGFKGTPYPIVISECIKLSLTFAEFSTKGFINGVLHRVAEELNLISGEERRKVEEKKGEKGKDLKSESEKLPFQATVKRKEPSGKLENEKLKKDNSDLVGNQNSRINQPKTSFQSISKS